MNAQRVVVTTKNTVELQPYEPTPPGPGELLIRTRATLISPGTERAFYMGLPNTPGKYPVYPGYSNIGVVEAIGEGVEGWAVGDRVASATAHAAFVTAAVAKCLPIPDAVSDESATFFNLMAIAMQGVHKAQIDLGEPVVVLGAGLIGLFAARLAQLSGGLPVVSIDRVAQRLELAKQLEVDETVLADDAQSETLAAHMPTGPAVVIEATGAPAAVVSAFRMAAVRGRVILLGSSRGLTDGINFYADVHRKGITIIGAHEITRPTAEQWPGWWPQIREQATALDLLARGRVLPEVLIEHRFAWSRFPEAYKLLENQNPLGMVIDWTQ